MAWISELSQYHEAFLSYHIFSIVHLFTLIHAWRLQLLSPHPHSLRRTISLLAMPFSGFMASHLLTSGATAPVPHWDRTLIYVLVCSLWSDVPRVLPNTRADIVLWCLVDGVVRTLGVVGVAGELYGTLSVGDVVLSAGLSGCVAPFLVQACDLLSDEWKLSSTRLRFNKDYALPFMMAALYTASRSKNADGAGTSHVEAKVVVAVVWTVVLFVTAVIPGRTRLDDRAAGRIKTS